MMESPIEGRGWPKAKVGNVAELNPDNWDVDQLPDELAYIDISSVELGQVLPSMVPRHDAPSRARRKVAPGDTIVSTVRPGRRAVAYWQDPAQNTVVSTGFAVLRPRAEIAARYLYYAILEPSFCARLERVAGGSAYPAVTASDVAHTAIPIPPLPTQRKIAAILGAFDDLIENNLRRIEILEEMARLIYEEWFVHYRFPGHEDVPMVDSPLGEIPQGWEVVRLGDVAKLHSDSVSPSQSEGAVFAHYSFAAFDEGRMPVEELGSNIGSTKYTVPKTALLLAKLNPRIPRVWLVTHDAELPAVCSTEFLVFTPTTSLGVATLHAMCASKPFAERFQGLASGTSTSHQRVRPDSALAMEVVQPTRHVAERAEAILWPIAQLRETLRRQNALLRQARDLLLAPLVSGEIDVSEMEMMRLEENGS